VQVFHLFLLKLALRELEVAIIDVIDNNCGPAFALASFALLVLVYKVDVLLLDCRFVVIQDGEFNFLLDILICIVFETFKAQS
jgi:hypothetical protein